MGGEHIPQPAERLPARLAFIQWQLNKMIAGHVDRSQVDRLNKAMLYVDELATICSNAQRVETVSAIRVCRCHERAGLIADVESPYVKMFSCRFCGDFRRLHGVDPPANLIRLHDRGISMTTSLLREAGIRLTSRRPGAA